MSGSLVHWDTVKLKTVEHYGMEIDGQYYEDKATERKQAKKKRDKLRKGFLKHSNDSNDLLKKFSLGFFKKAKNINLHQLHDMRTKNRRKYADIM